MKIYKIIIGCICLFICLVSCERKNNADTNVAQSEPSVLQDEQLVKNNKDTEVINNVYNKFVFAIETDGNDNPTDYFTANALKKLQDEYEFDCEDGSCYAYYALRTNEQDAKPDAEDVSHICNIEPIGDGWYVVSYLDMGWSGMTRVKTVDGKIDDYQRCVSDL